MSKLSDTQLVILSTACKRDDRLALPLPARITGNAATKVIASLLSRKLIEAVPAKPGQPVWGDGGDGERKTLVITDTAFAALGIEPDTATAEPPAAPKTKPKRAKTAKAEKPDTPRQPRKDSKQAQLIAMLQRAKGVTIAEIAEALDWQHHTVRGAIAGALKKKLGLDVVSEKDDKRGRTYRIRD